MRVKKHFDWAAPRDKWLKRTPADPPVVHPGTGERLMIMPPVAYLEIQRLGARQHIPPKTIGRPELEGIIVLDEEAETITIKTELGSLVLNVERVPGRYCCHCGDKLLDDDLAPRSGAEARKHVAEHHAGMSSPDKQNQSGYCKIGYFDCVPRDAHAEG